MNNATSNLSHGENIVTFDSDGKSLEGLLYIPDDYQEGEKRPGMAFARPASGVKEQTAGLYAKKFSEQGYITLAFDPKGFGGSEGVPQMEDPFSVVEDNKNAYTYLASLPQVDGERLIGAGVCMGAGHAVGASAEDDRIKATVALSPYLTSHIDYPAAMGGKTLARIVMGISNPLINLCKQMGIYFYIPVVPFKKWMEYIPSTDTQKGMVQYYGYEGKPGTVPNWKNKANFYRASNIMTGAYNPFDYIARFKDKPFFMAYGEHGYGTDKLRAFFDDMPSQEKEIMECKSGGHFDLYYKPEFTGPIVEAVTAFLAKNGLAPKR